MNKILKNSIYIGIFCLFHPECLAHGSNANTHRVYAFQPSQIMHDPDGSTAISIRDSRGILDAMEAGEVSTLQGLHEQILSERLKQTEVSTLMLGLCDAAIARVEGRFAESDAILSEALRQSPTLGNPLFNVNPVNIMLASLHVGNLMLAGRTHEWAIAQDELQTRYFSPIRQYFNLPDLKFRNVDLLKLNVPTEEVPEAQVSGPTTDKISFLGLEHQEDTTSSTSAEAMISMDGETTKATFDTGTLLGAVPGTMVRAHHWRVVGRAEQLSNARDNMRTAPAVLVPEITIGQTTLKNQIMTMHRISFPVIGLQQLGMLRHIKMTKSEMSFGASNPLSCQQPMVLASQRNGLEAHLLFPVGYGRMSSMGMMDSGDDSGATLVIRLQDMPRKFQQDARTATQETIFGQQEVSYSSQVANITVGSHQLHANVQYQAGHESIPPAITFNALANLTLQFDFRDGVSCLD